MAGNHLFFQDQDGPEDSSINSEGWAQLWQSNLSKQNTDAVRDLFPGTSFPGTFNLTGAGNQLFFTTSNPDYTNPYLRLWKYNPNVPATPAPYFTLVDAASNEDLVWVKNNDTIIVNSGRTINIRFNPVSETGSVVFVLNGSTFRTESAAPFALAGDNSGDYLPWNVSDGRYTLTARRYAGKGGTGTLLGTHTVNFYVDVFTAPTLASISAGVDQTIQLPTSSATLRGSATGGSGISGAFWRSISAPAYTSVSIASAGSLTAVASGLYEPGVYHFELLVQFNDGQSLRDTTQVTFTGTPSPRVSYFYLVNADADEDPYLLEDHQIIHSEFLPTRNLNIRAVTVHSDRIESVKLTLNNTVWIESSEPYAVFGDNNCNYNAGNLAPGSYTLTGVPYSGNNAMGTAGIGRTIHFTIRSGETKMAEPSAVTSVNTRCFPNPSEGTVQIHVDITEDTHAQVSVFDQAGHLKEILFEGDVTEGNNLELLWERRNAEPGIYLLKIKMGDLEKIEKLVIY